MKSHSNTKIEGVKQLSYIIIIGFIINIILITLILVLHYAMYTWTEELEKTGCECSNLWHRNVIHWFGLVIVILNVIYWLIEFFNIDQKIYYRNGSLTLFAAPFSSLILILTVSYISIIFDYITKLKKLECHCSESWKRDYGYIGSIVYIASYSLGLLLFIIGMLMLLRIIKYES
tara:strand:+ start:118 stop:642 length:525 start_codon:yes stop_codon:yes gene_type:complete